MEDSISKDEDDQKIYSGFTSGKKLVKNIFNF